MLINLLFLLLILVGVGLLIFWLVRQSNTGRSNLSNEPSNRALDILNERFARGEIGKEEYEERKATLLRRE